MSDAKPKKDYRTSVILSEGQHQQLQKIADLKDASIAWVIRQAIEKYLADQSGNQ